MNINTTLKIVRKSTVCVFRYALCRTLRYWRNICTSIFSNLCFCATTTKMTKLGYTSLLNGKLGSNKIITI